MPEPSPAAQSPASGLPDLSGYVALVTGASRGVGKGIALGLAERGATIYATARRQSPGDELVDGLGGSLDETADECWSLGGRCVPIRCDHRDDAEVEEVFRRVDADERGRLDLLVNNVWAGYQGMAEATDSGQVEFTWNKPFWEQPLWRWEAMLEAGARAHFVASRLAAARMVARKRGLIATISFWAAQKYLGNVLYGAAKAADDKMIADMAVELRPHNVAAVSLYPGLVRTEGVMRAAQFLDLSNSESPRFVGRAVAALAADPAIMEKTGQVLVAAQVALDHGFTDIDGKQPRPLSLKDV